MNLVNKLACSDYQFTKSVGHFPLKTASHMHQPYATNAQRRSMPIDKGQISGNNPKWGGSQKIGGKFCPIF